MEGGKSVSSHNTIVNFSGFYWLSYINYAVWRYPMIIDLKKDVFFREFSFEVFAEKYLKKSHNNAFIFKVNRFANLDVLIDYYKLNPPIP